MMRCIALRYEAPLRIALPVAASRYVRMARLDEEG
jgi:hypothetical protein